MTTSIAFMKWTDQGVRGFRDTVDRFEQARDLAKGFGVEIQQIFWTVGGPYDLVAVMEQTEESQYSAFGLLLESMGNLRITTVDAYGPDEMRAVIAAAGG